MLSTFCGQLIGTAAGNRIYASSGWIGSGSASVGFIGAALLVMLVRGPWEEHWAGWRGGWSMRKKNLNSADGKMSKPNNHVRVAQRDEELGAGDKVLAGVVAEDKYRTPQKINVEEKSDDEKSDGSVRGNEINRVEH
jgi:hypothetical protein